MFFLRRSTAKLNTLFSSRCISTSLPSQVKFASLDLDKRLAERIKHEETTPIQEQTILPMMNGKDLFAQAKTGTGKTLGFLVPIINSLLIQPASSTRSQIKALIVSPTRELASQIAVQSEELCGSHVNTLCFTGGGNKKPEANMRELARVSQRAKGGLILIGTPGRLNDLLENHGLQNQMPNLSHLVLDEGDTLLDGGFERELKRIISFLPPRHTALFSATVPQRVLKVASTALRPGYQMISTVEEGEVSTHERVKQTMLVVDWVDMYAAALAVVQQHLRETTDGKIILFSSTANGAAALAAALAECNLDVPVLPVHSRMNQSARDRSVNAFRTAQKGILVSSDVTARGIDIPNVTLVLQVGLATNEEQYVHRLGRTARAGKDGEGVIVLSTDEASHPFPLLRAVPRAPVPNDLDRSRAVIGHAFSKVDNKTIKKAYSAWLGYYKTQPVMKNRTEHLIKTAQAIAVEAMGYRDPTKNGLPPPLDPKLVGRMGLKSYKQFLNIVKDE